VTRLRYRPTRPRRVSGQLTAAMALVAAAAVWGATFLVVKDAVARMPVFDFLAWRFALAAGLLVAARPRAVRSLGVKGVRHGILLGLALGLAYATQAIGLEHTPAAVSGFLTGLFVVFTPVLSWLLLRRRLAPSAWLAVLLAGGGLALITLGGFAVGSGEFLTLGCAVLFGLQIVGTGEWSAGHDSFALATVQLATVAALSMITALATGKLSVPDSGADWFAITITAVLASALAYTIQTWAQTRLSATQAAVILTTEPVFAAVFAVALGGETLGLTAIAGGILVVAAMYLIQLRTSTGPQASADPAPMPEPWGAGIRRSYRPRLPVVGHVPEHPLVPAGHPEVAAHLLSVARAEVSAELVSGGDDLARVAAVLVAAVGVDPAPVTRVGRTTLE
jgi:drug/metabolite transporter (DMT)-like permease